MSEHAKDMSEVLMATPLRLALQENGETHMNAIMLEKFGFLYFSVGTKMHEVNLLEPGLEVEKIRISYNDEGSADEGFISIGRGKELPLFDFGDGYTDEAMEQAQATARELEPLLGYPLEENKIEI